MYSRPPARSDRRSKDSLRLPEHYSGCAFSPGSPHNTVLENDGSPTATFHATPSQSPQEPHKPPQPPSDSGCDNCPPSLPMLAGGVGELFGGHLPSFLGSIGFEELLLLGLILLLSHTEGSSDVILWLALLLFCK